MRQPVHRSAWFGASFLALAAILIVVRYFSQAAGERPAIATAAAPAPAVDSSPGTGVQPAPDSPGGAVRDVTPQGVARVFMPPPTAGSKRMPPASPQIRIAHAGVTPTGMIRGEG